MKRKEIGYGDFSEYQVRCLIAEYCKSVSLGTTGWGVSFINWVELNGIAKHDGFFRLIKKENSLFSGGNLEGISDWLVNGEKGASSIYLVSTYLSGKLPNSNPRWPLDSYDFERCLKVLEIDPFVRDCFPVLSSSCKEWEVLIQNWGFLEDLFRKTDGNYNAVSSTINFFLDQASK